MSSLKNIGTAIRQVQEKNDDKIDELTANVQKLAALINTRISKDDGDAQIIGGERVARFYLTEGQGQQRSRLNSSILSGVYDPA